MLIVETIGRIRREHFVKGKTIKEIVRDLKISRNTVRKMLRSGETSFEYERDVQPRPKLDRWPEATTPCKAHSWRMVPRAFVWGNHRVRSSAPSVPAAIDMSSVLPQVDEDQIAAPHSIFWSPIRPSQAAGALQPEGKQVQTGHDGRRVRPNHLQGRNRAPSGALGSGESKKIHSVLTQGGRWSVGLFDTRN